MYEDLTRQIQNSILADCCVVFIQEHGPEEHILGFGTLVSIHDTHAILTADHVADHALKKARQSSGCVRWFCPNRFDNSTRATPRASMAIEMEYLQSKIIGRGSEEDKGPDLRLLIVPDVIKRQSFSSTNTFYNLTKRAQTVLEHPCPIDTGKWVLVGTPAEWTATAEPEPSFDPLKKQPVVVGLGIVNNEYEQDNFDYLEFSLDFNGHYEGPTSFGGFSGGGLWHICLEKNETGKIVIQDPILSGVAFYQSPPKDANPIIRCHGRKSIYQHVIGTL